MRGTITSKGQITIPIAVRRRLGLKTGDVLEFDATAPFVKAKREVDRERMRSVIGQGKKALKGVSVKQWLDWTRGPSEYP